jgi:riboflavin transporter FmnP
MKSNFKLKLNANEIDALKFTKNVFQIQSISETNHQDFNLIKRLIYTQMIEVYQKIDRLSLQFDFAKLGLIQKDYVSLNLNYGQAIGLYLFLTNYPIKEDDTYLYNIIQMMICEINQYLN